MSADTAVAALSSADASMPSGVAMPTNFTRPPSNADILTNSSADEVEFFRPENYYLVALEEIALGGGSSGISLDSLWTRLAGRILPPRRNPQVEEQQQQAAHLDSDIQKFILAALASAPQNELSAFVLNDNTNNKARTSLPLSSLLRTAVETSTSSSRILLVASQPVRRRQIGLLSNQEDKDDDEERIDSDCWSLLELAGRNGFAGVSFNQWVESAGINHAETVVQRLLRMGLLVTNYQRPNQPTVSSSSSVQESSDRRFWLTRFAPSTGLTKTASNIATVRANQQLDRFAKPRCLDETLPLRHQLLAGLSDQSDWSANEITDSLAFGCLSSSETRSNLTWFCKRHLCRVMSETSDSYRAISLKLALEAAEASSESMVADQSSALMDVDLDNDEYDQQKQQKASSSSPSSSSTSTGGNKKIKKAETKKHQKGEHNFKRPLTPPPIAKSVDKVKKQRQNNLEQRNQSKRLQDSNAPFNQQQVLRQFSEQKICTLGKLYQLANELDQTGAKAFKQFEVPSALVKTLDSLALHGQLKLVTVRLDETPALSEQGSDDLDEMEAGSNRFVQLYAIPELAENHDAIRQLLSERRQLSSTSSASADNKVEEQNSEMRDRSSPSVIVDPPLDASAVGATSKVCLRYLYGAKEMSIFSRAQLAYEFCWYLLYSLPVDQGPVYPGSTISLDDDAQVTLPSVYSDTDDWRRFVFPLYSNSKADHYPKTIPSTGWIHKLDIVMRMPLAIYVSLIPIGSCNSPILLRYLNHPIMRWLPLATLPDRGLRALLLLRGRSLLLSRTQPFRVMSSMGLAYWLKRDKHFKDSGILYVTNRLTLRDTRPCKPVLDYIETQAYPQLCFELLNEADVLAAWRTIARIALHTPIDYTDPDSRANAVFQIRFIDCEDGDTIDDLLSETFGDHLGVCGFSSRLSRALIITDPRKQQPATANGIDEDSNRSLSHLTSLSLFGDMRAHLCELFDTKPAMEMPTTTALMRQLRRSNRTIDSIDNRPQKQQQQQQKQKQLFGRGRGQRPRQLVINAKKIAAKTREARRLARIGIRGSGENVTQQEQEDEQTDQDQHQHHVTAASSSNSSSAAISIVPTFSLESTRRQLKLLAMALAGAAPVSGRIWSAEEDTVLLFCHLAYVLVFNDKTCKFANTAAALIADLAPASGHHQAKSREVCQRRFNLLFSKRRASIDSFEAFRRIRDSLLIRLRHSATVRAWLVRPRVAWRRSRHTHPLAGDKAWREPHFRRIVVGLMHRQEAVELLTLTPPPSALIKADDVAVTAETAAPTSMDEDQLVETVEDEADQDEEAIGEFDFLTSRATRIATHADCMIDALCCYILMCVQSYAESDTSPRPDIDARLTAVINAYPIELAESALNRLSRHSELLGESPLVRAKHNDRMSLTSRRLKLRQGLSLACPPAVDAYFVGCDELRRRQQLTESESAPSDDEQLAMDVDVNGPVAAFCAAATIDSSLLQYKWDWSLERVHFLNLGTGSDLFNEAVVFDRGAAAPSSIAETDADNVEDDEATTSSLPSQLPLPPTPSQQQQQLLLPLFRFSQSSNSTANAPSLVPIWPPEFHCSVADADIDSSVSGNSRILRVLLEAGGSGGGGGTVDGVCGITPAELCQRLGLITVATNDANVEQIQRRQLADLDAELMRLIEAKAVFLVGYNVPYLVHRKLMRACLVNLNPRGLRHAPPVAEDQRYILPTNWSDHTGSYRPRRHAALLRRILSASAERSGCPLTALARSAGPTLGLVGLYKLLQQLRQFGCLNLSSAVLVLGSSGTDTSQTGCPGGLFAPRPVYRWRPATLFDDWRLITVQVLPDAEFHLARALDSLLNGSM